MHQSPTLDLSNDTLRSSVGARNAEKNFLELSAQYLSAKIGGKIGAKTNFGGNNFWFLVCVLALPRGFPIRA